jgi:hypothetical protein
MSAKSREHVSGSPTAKADAPYADEPPIRPKPDLYSADPPPGLSADFVTDLTQIYLDDIGGHALL